MAPMTDAEYEAQEAERYGGPAAFTAKLRCLSREIADAARTADAPILADHDTGINRRFVLLQDNRRRKAAFLAKFAALSDSEKFETLSSLLEMTA